MAGPRVTATCVAAVLCALLGGGVGFTATPVYDPLARPAPELTATSTLDRTVSIDGGARVLPLRIYLPAVGDAAPVVLFSHGLGGSNRGNAFLGEHWAARGYATVFVQHPGSDESVWRDIAPAQRRNALRDAASVQNFLVRIDDVRAVLDALTRWNGAADDPLRARFDLTRIGMSGHSFGALTTQAVAGQRFQNGRRAFSDPRIDAAVMFSPNAPTRGGGAAAAFGAVDRPWLLMTGTHDTALIGDATVESRLAVFPALPPGGKYELVLDAAEHSAFTDRALPGDREPRNPNHHRAMLAASTAFWDAFLRDDPAAHRWLDGDSARDVLQPADRWQRK
jgi:predicted dienelactone hydrolase